MHGLARRLRLLLNVQGSPNRVAAAFGVGVFIAFFPILGIHTIMAIGIAVALRLNKVAILTGAWINNPWTIAPMYTGGTLLGCALLGISPASLAQIDWSLTGREFYDSFVQGLRPMLLPFVLGNLLAGLLGGLLTFLGLRGILLRRSALAG